MTNGNVYNRLAQIEAVLAQNNQQIAKNSQKLEQLIDSQQELTGVVNTIATEHRELTGVVNTIATEHQELTQTTRQLAQAQQEMTQAINVLATNMAVLTENVLPQMAQNVDQALQRIEENNVAIRGLQAENCRILEYLFGERNGEG